MIKEEDIYSVIYFWEDKGDLDRMSSWDELRDDFAKEYPELIKAWDNYKTAARIMDIVVNSLKSEV